MAMACLNCTATVLRVLIHDTKATAFSHNALQRLALLPRQPLQVRMFRREESSYVRNDEQKQSTASSDDDFLPFEGDNLPPGTSTSSSPGREMKKDSMKKDLTKDLTNEDSKTPKNKKKFRRRDAEERERNDGEWRHRPKKDYWELPPIEEEKLAKKERKYEGGKWAKYVEGKDPRELEMWMLEKAAQEKKYGEEGFNPARKLSPEAIEGIRALHSQHPDEFTTAKLSQLFEVSPEAIKRILRSKWRPTAEEAIDRMRRWEKRHSKIFEAKVEAGEIITKSMKNQMRKARQARQAREKWGFSGGVSSKFL